MIVKLVVLGVARPKGSTRAFMRPGMRFPVVTSANKSVKGWEDCIRAALQQQAAGVFFDGPVSVAIVFYLPKPKSMSKGMTAHIKKPDLDKLARGSLDAMTGLLWKDDAQVVDLALCKRYTTSQPRALVEVRSKG